MKSFRFLTLAFAFFFAIPLVLITAGFGGCSSTVAPGGAYKGDNALYAADSTISHTVQGIDAFLKWETANHAAIKASNPKISDFANTLRDNVPKWVASISALRSTYLANPTPENATSVQNIVNLLTEALAQAATYLATPTVPAAVKTTP